MSAPDPAPVPAGDDLGPTGAPLSSLAVISGAARRLHLDRTPDRARGFLEQLAALGSVDLVVIHDPRASATGRRTWCNDVVAGVDVRRLIEVDATPLRPSGPLREIHLHRSDGPELDARRTAWFLAVDAFAAAAPAPPDLVWCGDLASLTRAGWFRLPLPAVVDIDRGEDLGSARPQRAARRIAAAAHLVTIDSGSRRDRLALPGAVVAAPGDPAVEAAIRAVAAAAAAYRPVRTS